MNKEKVNDLIKKAQQSLNKIQEAVDCDDEEIAQINIINLQEHVNFLDSHVNEG